MRQRAGNTLVRWERRRGKAVPTAGAARSDAAARCARCAWRRQPRACARCPSGIARTRGRHRWKALGDTGLQAKLREGVFEGKPRHPSPGSLARWPSVAPGLPRCRSPLPGGGGGTSGMDRQQHPLPPKLFPLGKTARFQPGSILSAAPSKRPGTRDVFQGRSSAGRRGGIVPFKD